MYSEQDGKLLISRLDERGMCQDYYQPKVFKQTQYIAFVWLNE